MMCNFYGSRVQKHCTVENQGCTMQKVCTLDKTTLKYIYMYCILDIKSAKGFVPHCCCLHCCLQNYFFRACSLGKTSPVASVGGRLSRSGRPSTLPISEMLK